ncbi:MAG: beta-lactamase family protein, partial [Flavobacteriales bacterium]|nr:beta-lactamase family protein [Flavobacteriales bacterium]
MKRLQRTFFFVLLIILVIYASLALTGNGHILEGIPQTYFRGVNKPDIDDLPFSDVREIPIGEAQAWPKSHAYNRFELSDDLLEKHKKYESTAYLIIENDSLLYEQYWGQGGEDVLSNSFSMAKSFTAMSIGVAADKGLLRTSDPVGNYLPRFKQGINAELSIKELLQMTSGINFGESYTNPFGYQAKSYYNDDLIGLTQDYLVSKKPGTFWEYQGGNTVILSELLEKETGVRLSQYFGENIWSKIGAEHVAYWGLDDEDGMEKAFSAVYATARDFARIGQLYLNNGQWKGAQVLSPAFVQESIQPCDAPDKDGLPANHYGYQWWLGEFEGEKIFMCVGMRGQYIICQPS